MGHVEFEGRYLTFLDKMIYYEVAGSGSFPVMLIHTAGSDGRMWHDFVRALTDRELATYKFYIVDLPGHGKSEAYQGRDNLSEFYASAVIELIKGLGLKPAVVGCSLGGNLALLIGAILGDKLRAVVACGGGCRTRVFTDDQIEGADPTSLEGTFYRVGRAATKEAIMKIIQIRSATPKRVYQEDLRAYNSFDICGMMDRITAPLLLIRGEDDPVATAAIVDQTASAATKSKRLQKVALEGLGHFAMIEDPVKFKESVLGFLSET